MIYLGPNIPIPLQDYTGFTLCKLWFMTKEGYDVFNIEGYDNDYFIGWNLKTTFKKVSAYKVNKDNNEIIRIKDKYYVGDGFGNVIYDPFNGTSNELKLYKEGKLPIEEKYFRD